MDIFHDIARRLEPAKLESLARFREAARTGEALPAALNELPMGFLSCVGLDDDLNALHVLSPLGMRVALAAKALDEEAA